MAIVTFGSIVTSIRGKIGGHCFSHGLGGATLMTKPNKKPRRRPDTTNMFNINSIVSNSWLALTDAQRLQWGASSIHGAVTIIRSSSIGLSGRQWYMKYNNLRYLALGNTLSTPSFTKLSTAPITMDITNNAGALVVTLSRALVTANEFILIYVSSSIPPTHSPRISTLRLIPITQANSTTFDITTAYTTVFGRIPETAETVNFNIKSATTWGGRGGVNHYGINQEEIK